MDPTMVETLQGVVKQSIEAVKAVLKETEVKVQNALQVALQENETQVQNTLQEAHDRIDAQIRNQQRHHDKDMRPFYDRMTTFRRGRGQLSRSPHPNPSTQWNGETSAGSFDESAGSIIPTRSQVTEHARSSRTGRTWESSKRHSRHYHNNPFDEIPPPPLGDELREHISGFHPFMAEVMMARLLSKWQWPHMDTYDGTSDPGTHVKS